MLLPFVGSSSPRLYVVTLVVLVVLGALCCRVPHSLCVSLGVNFVVELYRKVSFFSVICVTRARLRPHHGCFAASLMALRPLVLGSEQADELRLGPVSSDGFSVPCVQAKVLCSPGRFL